jgi:hypothetical protein
LKKSILVVGIVAGIFIAAIAFFYDCETPFFMETPPAAPSCVHSPSALPLAVSGSVIAIVSAIGLPFSFLKARTIQSGAVT